MAADEGATGFVVARPRYPAAERQRYLTALEAVEALLEHEGSSRGRAWARRRAAFGLAVLVATSAGAWLGAGVGLPTVGLVSVTVALAVIWVAAFRKASWAVRRGGLGPINDLYSIEDRSVALDLSTLPATFGLVFTGRGAR